MVSSGGSFFPLTWAKRVRVELAPRGSIRSQLPLAGKARVLRSTSDRRGPLENAHAIIRRALRFDYPILASVA